MVVLGIHCCMGFSLVATSRDYSVVAVGRTLISAASLNAEESALTGESVPSDKFADVIVKGRAKSEDFSALDELAENIIKELPTK